MFDYNKGCSFSLLSVLIRNLCNYLNELLVHSIGWWYLLSTHLEQG